MSRESLVTQTRLHRIIGIVKGHPVLGAKALSPEQYEDILMTMEMDGKNVCQATKSDILTVACTKLQIDPSEIVRKTRPAKVYDCSSDRPSDSRIRRVWVVVKNVYKNSLSEPSIEIFPPSGKIKVPKEVLTIAVNIHKAGKDACALSKEDLLKAAKQTLGESSVEMKDEIPSASKLAKIEAVMSVDFKDKMGKKDISVVRRDGSKDHFCKEVVEVAQFIEASGKDIIAAKKADIVMAAMAVFKGQKPSATAPVQKPEEKPAAKTLVIEEDSEESSNLEQNTKSSTNNESNEVTREDLNGINFALGAYTQIMCVLQLSELDNLPGAEKRRQKILELAGEYKRLSHAVVRGSKI
jgi:hypothetical protein